MFNVGGSGILVGTTILLAGLDAPLVLLLIAQAISSMVMVLYCALLIKLNRSVPPRQNWGRAPASWSGPCCSTASSRPRWW